MVFSLQSKGLEYQGTRKKRPHIRGDFRENNRGQFMLRILDFYSKLQEGAIGELSSEEGPYSYF